MLKHLCLHKTSAENFYLRVYIIARDDNFFAPRVSLPEFLPFESILLFNDLICIPKVRNYLEVLVDVSKLKINVKENKLKNNLA